MPLDSNAPSLLQFAPQKALNTAGPNQTATVQLESELVWLPAPSDVARGLSDQSLRVYFLAGGPDCEHIQRVSVEVQVVDLVEQSRDSGGLRRHGCREAGEIFEPRRHSKHQSKGAPAAYALHAHVFTASSRCCGVQSRPLSPRSQTSPSALELASALCLSIW